MFGGKNQKYTNTFSYRDSFIFDHSGKALFKTHILYSIIAKYPIAKHLTNVKILNNSSIPEADNGLVYFGVDANGKTQYVYGVEYVKKRRIKKSKTFLKVHSIIQEIQTMIQTTLSNSDNIDKNFVFGAILLFEMNYFIRLGKKIYLDKNNTTGIITLKKKNITLLDSSINIEFRGKANVTQTFSCNPLTQPFLFKIITKLYKQDNNSEFLFSTKDGTRITEHMLKTKLDKYHITFKDFRTYGVNIKILKKVYMGEDIKQAIKLTALEIGHTENISKRSYLSDELLEILKTLTPNKHKTYTGFLKNIVKELYTKLDK